MPKVSKQWYQRIGLIAVLVVVTTLLIQYYYNRPLSFYNPIRDLHNFTTFHCPVGKKCISVGTPYFKQYGGEWKTFLSPFDNKDCSDKCQFISTPSEADAVVFHAFDLPKQSVLSRLYKEKKQSQKWIFFNLESPVHLVFNKCIRDCENVPQLAKSAIEFFKQYWFPSYILRRGNQTTTAAQYFNWTITYRTDSTFYFAFYGLTEKLKSETSDNVLTIDLSKKKYMSYAVISNCHPYNERLAIISQLQKHMDVHVYGYCGDRSFNQSLSSAQIFEELSKKYYFHLSFESAFCKNYITEKFFRNGLKSDAIPLAFGGMSRKDYEEKAPPNSFVYAHDFNSTKQLADYLHSLSTDQQRYLSYFKWKSEYKITQDLHKLLKPKKRNLFCQICERLHSKSAQTSEPLDLNKFYKISDECRSPTYSPFH